MIERFWASPLGDYVAGCVTAVAVAAAVHAVVDPSWDLVLAVLAGTAIGTGVHLVVALPMGSLVGIFQAMIPGGLIGMYGGMLFAMRDSMQAASWSRVVLVALVFGIAVVGVVHAYDRALRATSRR